MATIIDPPNSVWPNGLKVDSEGYVTFYPLGTNKVDITTITWPDGDKLISPFVYQNDKLVGFIDTKALTVSGSATTTMNYSHIEADFASISEGKLTVNAPNATVKKFKWLSGNDSIVLIRFEDMSEETKEMFHEATKIIDNTLYDGENIIGTFDTNKLETASNIVYDFFAEDVTTTDGEMADALFYNEGSGSSIEIFESDLSSLTNGNHMFDSCFRLKSFKADLSNLKTGNFMFFNDSYLTSFDVVNLSSLKDGYMMFNAVPLKSFNCDLSSLEVGMGMFGNTSFDSASVKRILDTIKIHDTQRGIEIGINTSQPDLFAKEIGYNNIYDLELAFSRKGWTAYFLYNPEMSATYGLRNQNSFSIYAKLIEATSPIEKRAAKYMSQDGNKSYILHWYNSSANNEGYTQFNSLEEAIEHFNIKPIERN